LHIFQKDYNEYNVVTVRRRLVNVQIFVRGLAVCFLCKLFTRKCMQSFIRMLCVQVRGFGLNGCWRTSIAAYALNLQFLSGRNVLISFNLDRLSSKRYCYQQQSAFCLPE
ncbi:hypothetical protein T11_13427, partial [Trichinella zimbabwensis]